MARCLQIRVSAFTYDEGDVRKAWPVLWRWAFEETTPAFPYEMQGVLELVRALDDLYQFGDVPDADGSSRLCACAERRRSSQHARGSGHRIAHAKTPDSAIAIWAFPTIFILPPMTSWMGCVFPDCMS